MTEAIDKISVFTQKATITPTHLFFVFFIIELEDMVEVNKEITRKKKNILFKYHHSPKVLIFLFTNYSDLTY